MPLVSACVLSAHHDDQENILEVVPEAQRGAAEQSEVSLQELLEEAQQHNFSLALLPKNTNTETAGQHCGAT